MSIKDCIRAKWGQRSPDRVAEVDATFDEVFEAFRGRLDLPDAAFAAGKTTAEINAAATRRKKVLQALQAQAWDKIEADAASYRTRGGKADKAQGYKAKLARDSKHQAGYENFEFARDSIRKTLFAALGDAVAELRPKFAGLKTEKALARDALLEIGGRDTGNDAAKLVAQAWIKAAELARRLFNRYGGDIAWRADWMMPQRHNRSAIASAGEGEWRDFVRGKLNRAEMIDRDTGLPMSDRKLDEVLKIAYRNIVMAGTDPDQAAGQGRRMLANRRSEERILVFDSPETWLEYQERFGEGDIYGTMIQHLTDMAHDTAMLKVFGPNPDAVVAEMRRRIVGEAMAITGKPIRETQKAVNKARTKSENLGRLWNEFSRRNAVPVDAVLAQGVESASNTLHGLMLTGAMIPAIFGDSMTQSMARGLLDMPGAAGTVTRIMKMMTPGGVPDVKMAMKVGIINENWISHAVALHRINGDLMGAEWSHRFADSMLRATGLSSWTSGSRIIFGLDFAEHMASNLGRRFGDLPDGLGAELRRFGIDEAAWASIPAEATFTHKGVKMLDFMKLMEQRPEVGERMHHMLLAMTENAVVSSTPQAKLPLGGDIRPGTAVGSAVRSVGMFKTWTMTYMQEHLFRVLSLPDEWSMRSRGVQTAKLMVLMSVAGAATLQASNIISGRGFEQMDTGDFWRRAVLRGGGLGIYGDFLLEKQNRYGGGLLETLAGPMIGKLMEVHRLTQGTALAALDGEDPKIGAQMVDFLKYNVPGSRWWYLRLGFERLLWDQMALWADPVGTQRRFDRQIQTARTERDQEFIWKPGKRLPGD